MAKWAFQEDAVQAFLDSKAGILEMATGTGKTRVAMALMDILIRTNRAQRILFLTDRSELNDLINSK